MWSFIICVPHLMLFFSAIQKDEIGGVCGTCGRENIRALFFWWKKIEEKRPL